MIRGVFSIRLSCIPLKYKMFLREVFDLSKLLTLILLQLRLFIVNTIKTIPRDISAIYRLYKVKFWLAICKLRNATVPQLFDRVVKESPDKVCFHFGEEKWSFLQVQEYSCKVAKYFSDKGFHKGDCIGLMMSNRPEFVGLWLGLSRIGVITSWININFRQDSLYQCMKIGNTRAVIMGEECYDAMLEIHKSYQLPENFTWFILNKTGRIRKKSITKSPKLKNNSRKVTSEKDAKEAFLPINLLPDLMDISWKKPSYSKKVHFEDIICYVFTSGTTGASKAAIMTHNRMISMIYGPHFIADLNQSDILYTPLPLYHVQGGICGVGQALLFGITQVIVPKFSASRFWTDCVKYNATVAQYLGEVCRYLLKHSSPLERAHSVKKFFGNGMKTDIWKTFLDRFNYPVIMELYGSSEGNCQMGNFEGVIGICGSTRFGILDSLFPSPLQIFKVNEETGELIRHPESKLAIPCETNERGELLGLISDELMREFLGYTDPEATKSKVAFNIKVAGDRYFRSGDILYQDSLNYFHFVDRLGSSYRWKGENISSEEVTSAISRIVGLDKDIITFGVSVPHTDGKAGMTVIALSQDEKTKLDLLVKRINSCANDVLPSFARPIFIRFASGIDSTGTFKLQKISLQREGYNISKIVDPIYFLADGQYVELTKQIFDQVAEGKVKI